jgi:hypothetical protein
MSKRTLFNLAWQQWARSPVGTRTRRLARKRCVENHVWMRLHRVASAELSTRWPVADFPAWWLWR